MFLEISGLVMISSKGANCLIRIYQRDMACYQTKDCWDVMLYPVLLSVGVEGAGKAPELLKMIFREVGEDNTALSC